MRNLTQTSKPIKVVYIPFLFESAQLHIKAMHGLEQLSRIISPVDLVQLYLTNRALEADTAFAFLGDFAPFFKDDPWLADWQEDIAKEEQRRQLKDEVVYPLTVTEIVNSQPYFNGKTLFLFGQEHNEDARRTLNDFCKEVCGLLALQLPVTIYQHYEVFKEYCRLGDTHQLSVSEKSL